MTNLLRPMLAMPGFSRDSGPTQVPNTGRSGPETATTWFFLEDVIANTPGYTWTIPGMSAALLWDVVTQVASTAVVLDLTAHAYVLFSLENEPQLHAIPQENWPPSIGSTVCPMAWVDTHDDLMPRLLTPLVPYMWVVLADNTPVPAYLYNTNGTATGWSVPLPITDLSDLQTFTQVGTEIWFPQGSPGSVVRTSTTGAVVGTLTGFSSTTPVAPILVGTDVWVGDFGNNRITRWHTDGTNAGTALSQTGIYSPSQLLLVGTEVWVVSQDGPNPIVSHTIIARWRASDGAFLGSFDPAFGDPSNGEVGPLALIGVEVWYAQGLYSAQEGIYRISTGGAHIATITDSNITNPVALVDLDGKAWLLNNGSSPAPSITVYSYSGTPDALSPITYPFSITGRPTHLNAFGGKLWADNSGGEVIVVATDGTLEHKFNPKYGRAASSALRDMAAIMMLPLPAVSCVNANPTGGTGDGVTMSGLVGSGTTLTVTTNSDITFSSPYCYILFFDENATQVGYSPDGFVHTCDIFRQLGGVSHTYHAELIDDATSTTLARTNTVELVWPGAARPASATITNGSPSGGSAGDGTDTVSLVGTHGSEGIVALVVTTTLDVSVHGWHLLIVDETNTICGGTAYGTILAYTTGGVAATTHAYTALLSTSGTAVSGATALTNTVTVTWP